MFIHVVVDVVNKKKAKPASFLTSVVVIKVLSVLWEVLERKLLSDKHWTLDNLLKSSRGAERVWVSCSGRSLEFLLSAPPVETKDNVHVRIHQEIIRKMKRERVIRADTGVDVEFIHHVRRPPPPHLNAPEIHEMLWKANSGKVRTPFHWHLPESRVTASVSYHRTGNVKKPLNMAPVDSARCLE